MLFFLNRIAVLLGSVLVLVLGPMPVAAAGGPEGRGPLVSVAWLKANLDKPGLVLLDASAPPLYAKAHIPGAVSASILSFGVQEATTEKMAARYRSYGINNASTIVIYEQGEPMWAPHLFYDLYYHGFAPDRILLLDGGLEKWKADSGAVTSEPADARKPGDFTISSVREGARVKLPEVLVASGNPQQTTMLEALDPDWHYGETAFFDRGGHIPNGIMVPSKDFYNADRTFKSPAEIRKMLDYLGVKPGKPVYTYCGGGVAAAVPFFALKFIVGHDDVRLFRESQVGWLRDDRSLPFWTYAAPYMLRDTVWAKTWGGGMMRMYRNAAIDFIDVRSPEDFKFRHAKFAINLPADVFRKHLDQPEKLAALLGEAGVNPAHEAVVISGAGLTPESALVHLALERVGQQRVSVLADGLDKAALAGLAMNEEAKKPADAKPAALPKPVEYRAAVRESVLVNSAARTSGAYPKVFVASGQALPTKSPSGKVVHVPYAELLKPDGTPKSAAEIWKLLEKAGVPRYAELVAVSDDVGEAAVNYFVLKLMGFPDVKVMSL